MEILRAKFRVDSRTVVEREGTEPETVLKLNAVYSSDENNENHAWSKYTPCGDLSLTVTNPHADTGGFEPGKEFYIDLIPVKP